MEKCVTSALAGQAGIGTRELPVAQLSGEGDLARSGHPETSHLSRLQQSLTTMKRRKGKRKLKRNAKAGGQVTMRTETDQAPSPVEIVEIKYETENFGSPDAIRHETENMEGAVVASSETEKVVPHSSSRTEADRRAHPRYAFTAAIEVVAAEPGSRITTRVRDLSQQGCYVDTDSPLALGTITDVRIRKTAQSFEARARVVYNQPGKGMGLMFTAIQPKQRQTLDTWIAESRETSWLAANRRRSQRVLMNIPVRVLGQIGSASPIEEETHTLAISAHGAMIAVAAPVYRGQRFTLMNVQTKEALECVAAHVKKISDQQSHVGLEFMLPNPTFWRVAFPPKDWTPRHPDAKSK